jgi:hypothetical protein
VVFFFFAFDTFLTVLFGVSIWERVVAAVASAVAFASVLP